MEWRDTIAGRLIQADWLQENGLPHEPLRMFVRLAEAGGRDRGGGGFGGSRVGDGWGSGYGEEDGIGDGYGDCGYGGGDGAGYGRYGYGGHDGDGDGNGHDYGGLGGDGFGDGKGGTFDYKITLKELGTMTDGAVYVFVLSHGHVRVGRLVGWEDGSLSLRIDGGSVVRQWGTTAGLGQLAREGPLPATVLDPLPDGVLLQRIALIEAIPCDPAAWASLFPAPG